MILLALLFAVDLLSYELDERRADICGTEKDLTVDHMYFSTNYFNINDKNTFYFPPIKLDTMDFKEAFEDAMVIDAETIASKFYDARYNQFRNVILPMYLVDLGPLIIHFRLEKGLLSTRVVGSFRKQQLVSKNLRIGFDDYFRNNFMLQIITLLNDNKKTNVDTVIQYNSYQIHKDFPNWNLWILSFDFFETRWTSFPAILRESNPVELVDSICCGMFLHRRPRVIEQLPIDGLVVLPISSTLDKDYCKSTLNLYYKAASQLWHKIEFIMGFMMLENSSKDTIAKALSDVNDVKIIMAKSIDLNNVYLLSDGKKEILSAQIFGLLMEYNIVDRKLMISKINWNNKLR